MTLADKLERLRADFALIDDPHERLAAVVEQTRRLVPLQPGEKTAANRVRGCVSPVWIAAEFRDGCCYFRCEADSPLVHGLVAVLCSFFNGATAGEIAASTGDPLNALGIDRHLSPTRRHGLSGALAAIRAFAQTAAAR